MHIWVLTNEFQPYIVGGLGIVATKLTNELGKQPGSIRVFTQGNKTGVEVITSKSVKLTRFPHSSSYHSPAKKVYHPEPIQKWIDQHRLPPPDLIHVHSVQFTEFVERCKLKYKAPIIYTCHSLVATSPDNAYKWLDARRQSTLFQLADRIVVPSTWQKQQIEDIYPFCTGKISVIPNGVELNPSPVTASNKRLLFVGRVVQEKGIEDLLVAISLLKPFHPDIRLDIVGSGTSFYLRKLQTLCANLGIGSHVNWLGFKGHDSLLQMYAQYGAVVMPSKVESFGLVAIEALAQGVPLVCTRVGGLVEFVDSNVAEIIPRVTADEIARSIQIMWLNPALIEQRIANGLKRAQRYTWSGVATQYRTLFEQVTKLS